MGFNSGNSENSHKSNPPTVAIGRINSTVIATRNSLKNGLMQIVCYTLFVVGGSCPD